jgi:hypothetical protein
VSSLASSLVVQQAVSPPAEVSASSNVWPLFNLVPAGTEAHTERVSKIIFVVGNNNYSSRQPRAASAKVFASLELLKCDRERTSLLAFVNGEADLFTARNLVEQSKFAERLCIQGDIPGPPGGLYATMTKYEQYAGHEFTPYGECAFGPDIE